MRVKNGWATIVHAQDVGAKKPGGIIMVETQEKLIFYVLHRDGKAQEFSFVKTTCASVQQSVQRTRSVDEMIRILEDLLRCSEIKDVECLVSDPGIIGRLQTIRRRMAAA